jgi:hypothetical protein
MLVYRAARGSCEIRAPGGRATSFAGQVQCAVPGVVQLIIQECS